MDILSTHQILKLQQQKKSDTIQNWKRKKKKKIVNIFLGPGFLLFTRVPSFTFLRNCILLFFFSSTYIYYTYTRMYIFSTYLHNPIYEIFFKSCFLGVCSNFQYFFNTYYTKLIVVPRYYKVLKNQIFSEYFFFGIYLIKKKESFSQWWNISGFSTFFQECDFASRYFLFHFKYVPLKFMFFPSLVSFTSNTLYIFYSFLFVLFCFFYSVRRLDSS